MIQYSAGVGVGIIAVRHNSDAFDIVWEEVLKPHSIALTISPGSKCMAGKTCYGNNAMTSGASQYLLTFCRLERSGDSLGNNFTFWGVQRR